MAKKRNASFVLFLLPRVLSLVFAISVSTASSAWASTDEVVLYSQDFELFGSHWTRIDDGRAVAGQMLSNTGGAYTSVQSQPTHFARATFDAEAGRTYYVWVRGVASSISMDSFWLQFDGTTTPAGASAYRIGSGQAALYNGYGALAEPGWIGGDADNSNSDIAPLAVRFAATGRQTIQIQSRQGPMRLDEVWISTTQSTRPTPQTTTRPKDQPPIGPVDGWPIPDWQVVHDPSSVGLSPTLLADYAAWLVSRAGGRPYATIIIRGGKIGYEMYGDGATTATRWEIGSIRKSVASALLGMALEEGRLTLDTRVYDVWPEIYTITGASKDAGIVMRQLANATSGWRSSALPGQTWQYNNLAFTAGHAVIGRVYGMAEDKVAPMVEARIKDPIGASSWHVYHFTEDWYTSAGPKLAIDSNMRDLARLGYLWLRGGNWNGTQIIPGSYVSEATRNQVAAYGRHYGYWWFTNDNQALLPAAPSDAFYHIGFGTGGRHNVLLICPSLDLVAAISTHVDTFDIGSDYLSTPVSTVNDWIAKVVAAVQPSDPGNTSVTLFRDHFDRADSSNVGNGWVEIESVSTVDLASGALVFQPRDDAIRPMVRATFDPRGARRVKWSFDIDFRRTSTEKAYAFRMQLGEAARMSDSSAQPLGLAVGLVWGGAYLGFPSEETLGYVVGGLAIPIGVLRGPNTVEVRLDRDSGTYTVAVAGRIIGPIPFDGSIGIDTVRFFADGMNRNNFAGRRIDNVVVTVDR